MLNIFQITIARATFLGNDHIITHKKKRMEPKSHLSLKKFFFQNPQRNQNTCPGKLQNYLGLATRHTAWEAFCGKV